MISTKALNLLADALAPQVAEKITQSEEFIELLHKLIPAIVDEDLGECHEDLLFDLSMMVMERLSLRAM